MESPDSSETMDTKGSEEYVNDDLKNIFHRAVQASVKSFDSLKERRRFLAIYECLKESGCKKLTKHSCALIGRSGKWVKTTLRWSRENSRFRKDVGDVSVSCECMQAKPKYRRMTEDDKDRIFECYRKVGLR